MSTVIDHIKDKLTIVEALELYSDVKLRKYHSHKKQFNICCPLHIDKTPSFTVYKDSNRWKCWAGCGGGDVINLVSKLLNISNKEAINMLRKQLGIKQNYSRSEYIKRKDSKAILQGFEQTKTEISTILLDTRSLFNKVIKQVKSFNEIDQLIEVYHAKPLIEKYLEELESNDFEIQIATVKYLMPLLRRRKNVG